MGLWKDLCGEYLLMIHHRIIQLFKTNTSVTWFVEGQGKPPNIPSLPDCVEFHNNNLIFF